MEKRSIFREIDLRHGWLKDERKEADELFQLYLGGTRKKLDKFKQKVEQAKHKIISG